MNFIDAQSSKQSKKLKQDDIVLQNNLAELQQILQQKENDINEHQQKNSFYQLELQSKDNTILEKDKTIKSKDELIHSLYEQLRLAKHHRFGRTTEKFDPNAPEQYQLFDEPEALEEKEAIEKADEEITVASHKRKCGGRNQLPKDLPREEKIHDLSDEAKICACGCQLQRIGEDRSEQLKIIPQQMKVIVHVRYKYACVDCQCVTMSPLPKQPIPKSIATPSLLSYVLVSKYEDHLPLYRQEKIFQRNGIDLQRGTLCNWTLKCADLFEPFVGLLKKDIVQSDYVRCDETPVDVLLKGEEKIEKAKQVKKGWMFVYVNGDKDSTVYDYQPSRSGESAERFLQGFTGYLQTDGFSGYHRFNDHKDITRVGCWAHARRKFFDIVKATTTTGKAHDALLMIQKLYRVEKDAKAKNLNDDEKRQCRQTKSKPILDRFKIWLEKERNHAPPKSSLGKAISYALNRWTELTEYLTDGKVDIDNNTSENAIRPFAVGRKNWLFCGNDKGATASAMIYSIIETCKANKINTFDYLQHLLEKLPYCETDDDRQKLLPKNYKDNLEREKNKSGS